jgi:predicted aldo/keto reductase-like oxidoreductase
MGVFIISPSDKGGMLYKPPARLSALCQPLHPLVFNDLFCLARPQVHTLSIGAARPGDFDLHVAGLADLGRAAELLAPIIDRLSAVLRDTVGPQLVDPFALNLPVWQDTPGQINIPIILWLRGLALAYDMKEFGQMRYNLLGNGGHWFPGCRGEKAGAVDLSAIAAASGLGAQLTPMLLEAHALLGKEPVKRLSQSD